MNPDYYTYSTPLLLCIWGPFANVLLFTPCSGRDCLSLENRRPSTTTSSQAVDVTMFGPTRTL